MKKLLLFTALSLSLNLFAHFPIQVDTNISKGLISNVDFAPLQIGVGVFDNFQLYDGKVNTFISVALLGLMQKSAVLSFAPLNGVKENYGFQCGALSSITERNYLLSFGLINLAKNNYFLQLGLGNLATKYSTIQIGAVNTGSLVQFGIVNAFGKIQFGLLNYNPDAWIKWMPFFNFSLNKSKADTSLAASERPPHE